MKDNQNKKKERKFFEFPFYFSFEHNNIKCFIIRKDSQSTLKVNVDITEISHR